MSKSVFKKIAIVGAGIAGARLAALLADHGLDVLLFDHKAPWEKPCGGGLTSKIFEDFPDILNLNLGGRKNHEIEIITPFGRRSRITLKRPIVTISRKKIAEILINEAVKTGTEFCKEKVVSIKEIDNTIEINTKNKSYKSDFIVGADGTNSMVRNHFAAPFSSLDCSFVYGALIPGNIDIPIIIKFYKGRSGYTWVFPREEETSVGIIFDHNPGRKTMLGELQELVDLEWKRIGAEPPEIKKPFAKHIPSMTRDSFNNPALCGKNWALIGDASGAVDPLTGEGIYYAFKTAGLLSDAILSKNIDLYSEEWMKMASSSIGKVSRVKDLFYHKWVLRLIGIMMDYSMSSRRLIGEIIAGYQGYENLKQRMKEERFKYISEVILNFMKNRNNSVADRELS